MKYSQWFQNQLQTSADGFAWGVEQVPLERQISQPPAKLGEWTVARHVFHLLFYEQTIALPSMRLWLNESCPPVEDLDEDAIWATKQESIENMLIDFRSVRADQISLLPNFSDDIWNITRKAVWGPVTLLWVVSKTYQHTAEHTNDVMRIGLFWDFFQKQSTD